MHKMTHCKRGHAFLSVTTKIVNGKRSCRICRNAQERARFKARYASDVAYRRRKLLLVRESRLRSSPPKPKDGRCVCCGCEPKRLVLDHNHTTGENRDWVCDRCNFLVGSLESKEIDNAKAYLLKFEK